MYTDLILITTLKLWLAAFRAVQDPSLTHAHYKVP